MGTQFCCGSVLQKNEKYQHDGAIFLVALNYLYGHSTPQMDLKTRQLTISDAEVQNPVFPQYKPSFHFIFHALFQLIVHDCSNVLDPKDRNPKTLKLKPLQYPKRAAGRTSSSPPTQLRRFLKMAAPRDPKRERERERDVYMYLNERNKVCIYIYI